jgi:hypothetical protein
MKSRSDMALGRLTMRVMTERVLRFLMTWVSSAIVVAVWAAVLWALFGVGPSRLLFWILLGPLAALLASYEAFNFVRRMRGVDVRAEKGVVAAATAAELRRRYGGGRS